MDELMIVALLVIILLMIVARNLPRAEAGPHADGTPGCDVWCDCRMVGRKPKPDGIKRPPAPPPPPWYIRRDGEWHEVETDTTWKEK